MDTGNSTLNSALSDGTDEDASRVWTFRVVYAASAGIVRAPAVVWNEEQPLGIGRRSVAQGPSAWVSVQDERVSREHARVYRGRAGIVVEDLHSRNGSARNGIRLKPTIPQPLQDGDVLRVGDSFVVVRHEPETVLDAPVASFIGISRRAGQVRCAIARSMCHERAVLILGETGTGKEVTAQAIHLLSQRAGQMVAVNCAAIPATLAEAQLFGVEKGAFTGAIERLGAFAEAEHGTLFLDEVGELPAEVQPKLLRVLETREVLRVGGRRPVVREVRILSATNRNLEAAIREGTFRADLYARLSSEVIHLPPLRERREDILLLAQKLAGSDFCPSPRMVAMLLAHSWPLNVRELGHVVARLRDGSEDEVLRAFATSTPLAASPTPIAPPPLPQRWHSGDPIPTREQVLELLSLHRGNLTHIEEHSGYSRRQFRRWAEGYGIDVTAHRKK